jgi:hypothetical protein
MTQQLTCLRIRPGRPSSDPHSLYDHRESNQNRFDKEISAARQTKSQRELPTERPNEIRPVGRPEATQKSRTEPPRATYTQMPGQRSFGMTVPLNRKFLSVLPVKSHPTMLTRADGCTDCGQRRRCGSKFCRGSRISVTCVLLHCASSMRLSLGTRPLSRRCEIGRAACILPPIVVPPREMFRKTSTPPACNSPNR